MNWNEWFANALSSETPKHVRGNDRLTAGLSYGSGEAENRIEVGGQLTESRARGAVDGQSLPPTLS